MRNFKINPSALLLLFFVLTMSSCADVQRNLEACLNGHVYGFWGGLWHGTIAGFAFIGSLFSDNIAVWAVNNNGGWYHFGFLLGVVAFSGGVREIVKKRKK